MHFSELADILERRKLTSITEAGGVVQNFMQGLKGSYNQASGNAPQPTAQEQDEVNPDPKMYQVILGAVGKVYSKAAELSKKYHIPLPLVLTLGTAASLAATMGVGWYAGGFLTGMAAIKFVVRKYVREGVTKVAGAISNTFAQPAPAAECLVYTGEFALFVESEMLDKIAGGMGRAIGYGAGKMTKAASAIANGLKSTVGNVVQWAGTHKMQIGVAIAVFAIMWAFSSGVAAAADTNDIIHGIQGSGIDPKHAEEAKQVLGGNGVEGVDQFDLHTYPSAKLWTDYLEKTGTDIRPEFKQIFFGLDIDTSQKLIAMRVSPEFIKSTMMDVSKAFSDGKTYMGPHIILKAIAKTHEETGGKMDFRTICANAKQIASESAKQHGKTMGAASGAVTQPVPKLQAPAPQGGARAGSVMGGDVKDDF